MVSPICVNEVRYCSREHLDASRDLYGDQELSTTES